MKRYPICVDAESSPLMGAKHYKYAAKKTVRHKEMCSLALGVPTKEKLEAKALKVATVEPASAVLFLEWNRLWELMEPADLRGNGGRGGSISKRGGGSLAKRSMKSIDGLGGVGFVVVGGSKGEVKGDGVNFEVSRILLDEIPEEIIGESDGEVFGVDGGAV
ncbi:hypothetical protein Tco_1337661 [Tanacetum coccineum]